MKTFIKHFKSFYLTKKLIPKFFFSMKLNINEYLSYVDKTLMHINDNIESLELDEIDCNFDHNGVLNFSIDNKKYVLNIQRPNQQLWLSSPVSGPLKFEYEIEKNRWIDVKHQYELYELLTNEINSLLKGLNLDSRINLL